MKKEDSSGKAEKTAATLDEIETAYRTLTKEQRVRLARYARRRVAILRLDGQGLTEDDLLQEALTGTLEGTRKWYKNSVDFVGHLCGVMRSISSHPPQHLLPDRSEHVALESEFVKVSQDGEERNLLAKAASPTPSPERLLEFKEMIELIEKTFKDDPEVTLIIDGFRQNMAGSEIRKELGLTDNQYYAALKRLRWTVKTKLNLEI